MCLFGTLAASLVSRCIFLKETRMGDMLLGNTLWQLILQSDAITKTVFTILLIMSIICWSIFLYKSVLLRTKRKHALQALSLLQKANTLDDILKIGQQLNGTVPGYFIARNLRAVYSLLELQKKVGSERGFFYWQQLEGQAYQSVEEIADAEESYLWVLSTSAAAATLLGLFGTVWGLVHAFLRISQKQSADIVTVAPGIAEALMTTLIGLIVAIPALILFNYLSVQVRRMEGYYMEIAAEFCRILQILFLG